MRSDVRAHEGCEPLPPDQILPDGVESHDHPLMARPLRPLADFDRPELKRFADTDLPDYLANGGPDWFLNKHCAGLARDLRISVADFRRILSTGEFTHKELFALEWAFGGMRTEFVFAPTLMHGTRGHHLPNGKTVLEPVRRSRIRCARLPEPVERRSKPPVARRVGTDPYFGGPGTNITALPNGADQPGTRGGGPRALPLAPRSEVGPIRRPAGLNDRTRIVQLGSRWNLRARPSSPAPPNRAAAVHSSAPCQWGLAATHQQTCIAAGA